MNDMKKKNHFVVMLMLEIFFRALYSVFSTEFSLFIYLYILTYWMVQQLLKNYDRPLMRVSLSDSIFSYIYFILEARVMGDKSIET